MTSLLDIAPAQASVTVRGQALEVHGVSAAGIAQLLVRFPELEALLSGKDVTLDTKGLVAIAPRAVSVIIAAGTGHAGETEFEDAAEKNLTAGEQLEVLEAVIKLTMPEGVGPFVEKLLALVGVARLGGAADRGKAQATS